MCVFNLIHFIGKGRNPSKKWFAFGAIEFQEKILLRFPDLYITSFYFFLFYREPSGPFGPRKLKKFYIWNKIKNCTLKKRGSDISMRSMKVSKSSVRPTRKYLLAKLNLACSKAHRLPGGSQHRRKCPQNHGT